MDRDIYRYRNEFLWSQMSPCFSFPSASSTAMMMMMSLVPEGSTRSTPAGLRWDESLRRDGTLAYPEGLGGSHPYPAASSDFFQSRVCTDTYYTVPALPNPLNRKFYTGRALKIAHQFNILLQTPYRDCAPGPWGTSVRQSTWLGLLLQDSWCVHYLPFRCRILDTPTDWGWWQVARLFSQKIRQQCVKSSQNSSLTMSDGVGVWTCRTIDYSYHGLLVPNGPWYEWSTRGTKHLVIHGVQEVVHNEPKCAPACSVKVVGYNGRYVA